jgi:DNA-binding MarR family transcriptional regulator
MIAARCRSATIHLVTTTEQTLSALPSALTGHAGYLAVLLGQRAQLLFETAIAPLDLRPAAYDFLATVAERGPLSQRELADTLRIDAARIVAMTDELEGRGLVARSVDPSDRRRNQVALTAAGKSLTTKVRRVATKVEVDLLSALSVDERTTLRALMRRSLALDSEVSSGG